MHSPFTSTSSPGSSFRQEEDSVILEIGSRWLRAGFEGNSTPMCTVGFGPEEARRVGDYRGWIRSGSQDAQKGKIRPTNVEEWSKHHELWRRDIRGLDIGLFEDKLERAIRELYNKYLLTDAGSSRLVLVLPPIVPHILLSSLLSTIFHRWRYPNITLLPSTAMAAVAAGVRSALVIDIGWEETTVTALYEYREIQSKRSTCAMKLLLQCMGKFLTQIITQEEDANTEDENSISVSFELCEEILTRLAWCKTHAKVEQPSVRDEAEDSDRTSVLDDSDDEHSQKCKPATIISLPFPVGNSMASTDIPFSKFSEMIEEVLFAGGDEQRAWDDEDTPLDMLVYNTLLALSPDVRGSCMSRITFIGGGSKIPGLRQRIIEDVESLISQRQWRLAQGKVLEKKQQQSREIDGNGQRPIISLNATNGKASQQAADTSFIDERIQRKNRDSEMHIHGVLRQVESLGPWAGASLVASLKIRGLVEVDREKFLQHGLLGASRDYNINALMDRRSGYGPGLTRTSGDRSSWTLGEWA